MKSKNLKNFPNIPDRGGLDDSVIIVEKGASVYPEILELSLGDKAPEVFYCLGNISLLQMPAVMICGSRKASETGLDTAFKIAAYIAHKGLTVSSGYARGIDMAAHAGALDAGGNTIAILPYGIMKFKIPGELSGIFDPERFLAVSEMPPFSTFTISGAFRRNQILTAFSSTVIAVEPGDTGGTWHSVRQAWKMGRSLYYNEGGRPDLAKKLEESEAVRIDMSGEEPLIRGL